MFVMRANSAEEMKESIVKWLKWNASNHRVKESNAHLMGTKKHERSMATAYQHAAEFLERVKIETTARAEDTEL